MSVYVIHGATCCPWVKVMMHVLESARRKQREVGVVMEGQIGGAW